MTNLPPSMRNVPRPAVGATSSVPDTSPPPSRAGTRAVLAEVFPEFATITGGFSELAIELPTIPAGQAAWWPLINRPVRNAFGEEVGLFAAHFDLLSCDVDGGGGNGAISWGNQRGQGAAIVVGKNLPSMTPNQWTVAPHRVPGLDSATASITSDTSYFLTESFPPGKFDAATPIPRSQPRTLAPTARRYNVDESIQAAFVLSSTYASQASGTLYAKVLVQLHVALTQARQQFQS